MSQTMKDKFVQCPSCRESVAWNSANPNRPFCSESCKNRDFVEWANERNSLPGNPEHDELFSSELGEQHY